MLVWLGGGRLEGLSGSWLIGVSRGEITITYLFGDDGGKCCLFGEGIGIGGF